jgi:hypothetical protein
MRELVILALIAVAGYLAYDDFYKQRPALQQAQAEIQQLRQNPARAFLDPVTGRRASPNWLQKKLNESSSSLDRPTPGGGGTNPHP